MLKVLLQAVSEWIVPEGPKATCTGPLSLTDGRKVLPAQLHDSQHRLLPLQALSKAIEVLQGAATMSGGGPGMPLADPQNAVWHALLFPCPPQCPHDSCCRP